MSERPGDWSVEEAEAEQERDVARLGLAMAERIAENVAIAIVSLPNSGGVSWSEAHAIGMKVAQKVLG